MQYTPVYSMRQTVIGIPVPVLYSGFKKRFTVRGCFFFGSIIVRLGVQNPMYHFGNVRSIGVIVLESRVRGCIWLHTVADKMLQVQCRKAKW